MGWQDDAESFGALLWFHLGQEALSCSCCVGRRMVRGQFTQLLLTPGLDQEEQPLGLLVSTAQTTRPPRHQHAPHVSPPATTLTT
jgi:hypothetical protein